MSDVCKVISAVPLACGERNTLWACLLECRHEVNLERPRGKRPDGIYVECPHCPDGPSGEDIGRPFEAPEKEGATCEGTRRARDEDAPLVDMCDAAKPKCPQCGGSGEAHRINVYPGADFYEPAGKCPACKGNGTI